MAALPYSGLGYSPCHFAIRLGYWLLVNSLEESVPASVGMRSCASAYVLAGAVSIADDQPGGRMGNGRGPVPPNPRRARARSHRRALPSRNHPSLPPPKTL